MVANFETHKKTISNGRKPWLFGLCGGVILPFAIGVPIISHDRNPY